MKNNIRFERKFMQNSFVVTKRNLERLHLKLKDIEGLLFETGGEYQRMNYALQDATTGHDQIITNLCLSELFHSKLRYFLKDKDASDQRLALKIASELPLCMEVFNAQKTFSQYPLIKSNFEYLFSLWQEIPRHDAQNTWWLWKFSYQMTQAYPNELLIVNMEKMNKLVDSLNKGEQAEFKLFKDAWTDYTIRHIEKRDVKMKKLFKEFDSD